MGENPDSTTDALRELLAEVEREGYLGFDAIPERAQGVQ